MAKDQTHTFGELYKALIRCKIQLNSSFMQLWYLVISKRVYKIWKQLALPLTFPFALDWVEDRRLAVPVQKRVRVWCSSIAKNYHDGFLGSAD